MTEPHVQRITRQLGGENALAEALGLTKFSVRAARREGAFPARWYAPLKALCDEHGVPCPLVAFNWLAPDKKTVEADGATPALPQGQDERGAA